MQDYDLKERIGLNPLIVGVYAGFGGEYFNLSGKLLPMSETGPACRYICLECAYIYDPVKGDPKGAIPPGTTFEKLPDTWRCPECKICKVKKGVFKRLDA